MGDDSLIRSSARATGKDRTYAGPIWRVLRVILLLSLGFFPCHAQELLLDSGELNRHYILQLAGRVNHERFDGAKAVLTLSPPPPLSLNPYQIIIEGFPRKNARNSFFWNSQESSMSAFANEIVCDIKRHYAHRPDIHFFYLSPVLLEQRLFMTQREAERRALAEEQALPTKVMAISGRLRVQTYASRISGSVVMKGYDPVERAYVEYAARFTGRMTAGPLQPSQELKK